MLVQALIGLTLMLPCMATANTSLNVSGMLNSIESKNYESEVQPTGHATHTNSNGNLYCKPKLDFTPTRM